MAVSTEAACKASPGATTYPKVPDAAACACQASARVASRLQRESASVLNRKPYPAFDTNSDWGK